MKIPFAFCHRLGALLVTGLLLDGMQQAPEETRGSNPQPPTPGPDPEPEPQPGGERVRLEGELADQYSNCAPSGTDVKFTYGGSFVKYDNVNLGDGYTTLRARYAKNTPTTSGVECRLGSPTGTLIGEATIPRTGGWTVYEEATASLTGASGVHDVYFVFKGDVGTGNYDWFQFEGGSGGGDADLSGPVVVRAQGSTGEEQITLLVNGQPTGETVTLTSQMQNYTCTWADASAQVQVQFVNDGNTDDGRDKNVRVDFLQRLGVTEQAKNQSENTSSWNSAQRQCGGVSSEWLYCEGLITFPALNRAARTAISGAKSVSGELEANPGWAVYPNPSHGSVRVHLPGEVQGAVALQILDLRGKVLRRKQVASGASAELSTEQLSAGTYLIRAVSGGQQWTQRLVVE